MTKKKETLSEELINENKSETFKYILFFVVFFVLGIILGVVVAKKFLVNDEKDSNTTSDEEPLIKDISNEPDYQNTIADLKNLIGQNLKYYSSKGVDASQLTNDEKLQIVYEYVIRDTNLETAIDYPTYWESQECATGFLVDLNVNDNGTTYNAGFCTYFILPYSKVMDSYRIIFNNENIQLTTFDANENYRCIAGTDNYACGLVKRIDYTGTIENHFVIRKVTLEEDGTINIYESGYLKDTRSFVNIADDGIDNYYLHSSDSELYYYELRKDDNLTFKHVFKKDANNKYYYVKTVLE